MAPAKNSKTSDLNPWGWVPQVKPEDVSLANVYSAYRVMGFHPCQESRRNCKRNPYCLWGLGEKKWKEDSEGDDEDEGAAFRCEGEYAGLQNLGATCYVNSLLQLWFHNPIFRPAILKWTPGFIPDNETSVYQPACPLAQLQAIFARMKISKRSKIDPSDFIGSLLLNTGEQQDAQEFAKLFMDLIVKLLSDYGDDQIRKLIAQSCNGQLQYETECLGCKNKTQRSEVFTELNLSVKKNLSESLDALLADETLSDEYMCSNCQRKTTAKRRMQLLALPPVLNLQLLRFVYDREAHRRKKVTQNISFPEVLEMHPRIHRKHSDNANSAQYKYHLTAVLIHNGQSASSGHYVAQIKDLRNGEWLKFNDEFVDPVHKGKNQKSKDEESDGEKKSKPKKSKNSPSLQSSGAYMLVYTLDRFIKNPEPDPELHQYLVDLVKLEDTSFEEEVNKNKNEKDFEFSVKLRRRKEVEWLYEFGKNTSSSNGKRESDTSDAENIEEPKTKVARYDNESSDNKNSKDVHDDSCRNGDTKINGNSSIDIPPRKKHYELDEYDFVSVDWIMQWLDPGNPVPPVENGMLTCEHKKLAPPAPNSTPCLYRMVPTPLVSAWFEVYQGTPRLRASDLCELCVQNHCRRLRALAELDEDFKKVSELVKKCDSECSSFAKSGEPIPDSFLQDKSWVSKESMRNWKKMAKKIIEGPTEIKGENNSHSKDETEVQNADNIAEDVFNADLLCEHGNLTQDVNSRKVIPNQAMTIIGKYLKIPQPLPATASSSCDRCRSAERESSAAVQQRKEIAAKQKAALSDLYSSRNRPDTDKMGEFYIVSSSFVAEWRRFVKDPTRLDPVRETNNSTLICQHKKFMYPLQFVSEFLSGTEETDEMVYLITPDEWKFIKENFNFDIEIKVKVVTLEKRDNLEYEPDICKECAEQWLVGAFESLFQYTDCPLYIIKKEKGETVESEEEEPAKESIIVTGKREVKPVNPDAWMSGCSSSVRRTTRPRNAKGEKTYKVSSTITIKELKSKICSDFKAMLSDQHLYFEGKELTDLTKTLAEYRIPARAKVYLEIDTAENGKVDEPMSAVETGFQGTLLGGGNQFGDTRSPVQSS